MQHLMGTVTTFYGVSASLRYISSFAFAKPPDSTLGDLKKANPKDLGRTFLMPHPHGFGSGFTVGTRPPYISCALSFLRRSKDSCNVVLAILVRLLEVVQFLVQVSNVRFQLLNFHGKTLLHFLGRLQNEPSQTINNSSCQKAGGKGSKGWLGDRQEGMTYILPTPS